MTADIELSPESRALDGCAGTPVVLADGRAWLLRDGGLLNELDALRDAIDDDARLSGGVELVDAAEAAGRLLVANYELTPDEVRGLIVGAVDQAFVDAVMLALFGPAQPRRTYTAWAASALLANGLDPASIPTALMPHVLAQLEATGRCIPRSDYIESAEAAIRRKKILARVRPPEPPAPAAPAPMPVEAPPADG